MINYFIFFFLKSMVSTSSGLMLKAPNNYILYLSWIYLLTKKYKEDV